jgi:hypothetical protein
MVAIRKDQKPLRETEAAFLFPKGGIDADKFPADARFHYAIR